MTEEQLNDEELAVLLERFNQMACLLTGESDAEAECSYCHGTVSLGEALLTAHISGVLAHIKCPKESLDKIIEKVRPDPGFDFENFVEAVDERIKNDGPDEAHGELEVAVSPGANDPPKKPD